MDRLRRLSIQTGHLDELVQDHLKLAAAVAAGDAAEAQSVMQLHLRRIMADTIELSERFPQFFETTIRSW
jgi:DNA-binding GntR family transcriptional regulator